MAKHLRDSEQLLTTAVAKTISELRLQDIDTAAAKLARHYAEAIDAGHCSHCNADTSLEVLGPKLLSALAALGATPAARAAMTKGGAASATAGRLQALRDARA